MITKKKNLNLLDIININIKLGIKKKKRLRGQFAPSPYVAPPLAGCGIMYLLNKLFFKKKRKKAILNGLNWMGIAFKSTTFIKCSWSNICNRSLKERSVIR